MDDVYSKVVEKIVREQENIIGPLALEQAKRVYGLEVDLDKHQVNFKGDKNEILDHLVEQYKKLFGQTSVQVCKDAARPLLSQLPAQEVPSLLK